MYSACTKYVGRPGINTTKHPIAIPFSGHGGMNDLTTERSFDWQASPVSGVLCLFF